MVGVGLKVVLFSSSEFSLRAKNSLKTIRVELKDANRYGDSTPPQIELPYDDKLPEDTEPLFDTGTGTEVSYKFPIPPSNEGVPEQYLRDVYDECIEQKKRPNFEDSLSDATIRGGFPNRLAALISSHLRRYTYLGCTQEHKEFSKLKVVMTITGTNRNLGPLAPYADGKKSVRFEMRPNYLQVSDTIAWAKNPRPVVQSNVLGEGGTNIAKTKLGFNVTTYTTPDEYESLLFNARGKPSDQVENFRKLLFPKINKITLTIGRIPQFQRFLPGGSRRIISARGVVTQHDIDVSSGQNQQYLRCFDIVIDVDSDLNYGKTHLTNKHLVSNVRKFVNEAYRATIQNATRNFVGTLKNDEPTEERFWSRRDLGVDGLAEKKIPHDENDVIALFFELTGMGHFREFHWFGLSSRDTYDGRAIIRRAEDSERLHDRPRETDLQIIEFKLRGASIARDFDRDEKQFHRVKLVICYEIGTSPIELYQVVEFQDSDTGQSDGAACPGVTHVLLDTVTGRELQILPLKDYLNANFAAADPASIPEDVAETD